MFNGNSRYIFICMYRVFYGTFTHMSTNYRDTAYQTAHFMLTGVALQLTPRTVILHTHTHRRRKGNKLKRRREREREARQNESEIKKEARLEVKL